MAGVVIDSNALRRDVARQSTHKPTIGFQFTRINGEALYEEIAAAVEFANSKFDATVGGEFGDAYASRPISTPGGTVAFVTGPTAEALYRWAEHAALALSRLGWQGQISLAKPQRSPLSRRRPPLIAPTAVLAFHGWTTRMKARREQALPIWCIRPDAARTLSEWASGWTSLAGGRSFLQQFLMSTEVNGPHGMPPEALQNADRSVTIVNYRNEDSVRYVSFDPTGRVVVQLRSPEPGWQNEVNDLRAVIDAFAPDLEFAFVRQGNLQALDAVTVVTTLEPRQSASASAGHGSRLGPYLRERRDLDKSHVPDAYGLQFLTDEHLSNIHDLSSWVVSASETAAMSWVEAPDLAPWFASPQVSQSLVDQARADFGSALLTNAPARHEP